MTYFEKNFKHSIVGWYFLYLYYGGVSELTFLTNTYISDKTRKILVKEKVNFDKKYKKLNLLQKYKNYFLGIKTEKCSLRTKLLIRNQKPQFHFK